jgi:hypothetical protein
VGGNGFRGVRAAGRLEPAARPTQCTETLVDADEPQQQPGERAHADTAGALASARRPARTTALRNSDASSAGVSDAVAGPLRMTSSLPAGTLAPRSASACRIRRRTRLRATAFPAGLPTTTAARNRSLPADGTRLTSRSPERARAPVRETREMSDPVRSRCGRGSTRPAARLRPRARRGPCGDGRTGWRAPRGCACAAGIRASWHDDGCSAGTCACSTKTPRDGARTMRDGHGRTGRADRRIWKWSVDGRTTIHGSRAALAGSNPVGRRSSSGGIVNAPHRRSVDRLWTGLDSRHPTLLASAAPRLPSVAAPRRCRVASQRDAQAVDARVDE